MSTIYKNENAKKNPYWFQFMVDGKRYTKRGFRTKGEAREAMVEMQNAVNKNSYIEPSKLKFRNYFKQWLDSRTDLAISTKEMYLSYLRTHFDSPFGETELSKITPIQVQKFVSDLSKNGYADHTIKRIFSSVNACLNSATRMDILPKNVASKIDKPRIRKKERKVWSAEDVSDFLDKTKGKSRYWFVFFLAVRTGMRQGEILGLRWSDIDLENKRIYIQQALSKNGKYFTQVKTNRSARPIAISDEIIVELKKQQEIIQMDKDKLGKDYEDNELVVCSEKGTPTRSTAIMKIWWRWIENYKMEKISFHDLRHVHASILLKGGVHPKVVSERLGHSTVSITLDTYSHLIPDMQDEAVISMEKILSGKQK